MQLTHLGPYVIDKPLGKGGMGSVYAATDPETGQRVAIKALTPHLAAAEGFRERFEAEIESLKTLRHEGIVRLYGYGEQDGVLFYSMELVDGISLEDEIKAGRRFNWREVTNIAIQLSLALKHAHDHGIVHRDIKPANILLDNEDHVKLADFGIARLFGTTSLTTAGGVLGTADYMSPEQADGRPVTARCDQYSLGGVMYALLAGRPPFRAKNLPQMLQLQRFANPEPVRRYAPDTPEQLDQVIMQLLAKDPSARFPNTQVLARHLQAMVNALSRPAADDFALDADQPPFARPLANLHESLSAEATQAEVIRPQVRDARLAASGPIRTVNQLASQDAATLAAEELALEQAALGSGGATAEKPLIPQLPPESTARFTTVEEEELRLRRQNQRSWPQVAAQLGGLVAVLAGIVGAALYLSRPPSADNLYASIDARVEGDDDVSLARVENQVNAFLHRFPDDPRANVLRNYQERIELDKLERRLQRLTRGGGINPSLLPAEQLYLQAIGRFASTPDESLAMLESLVDLYGAELPAGVTADSARGVPNGAEQDAANRTADVVQLAQRRLKPMRADIARQQKQQLAALEERLAAAERLSATNPQQAAAMYRAILKLHASNKWAEKVVETARGRLAKLEAK
jgi:serine/threonine-protein kinase